jgi:hypothetical protein
MIGFVCETGNVGCERLPDQSFGGLAGEVAQGKLREREAPEARPVRFRSAGLHLSERQAPARV